MTNKNQSNILYLDKHLNNKVGDNMGMSETLKAISDPVRREILNLLKDGKKTAGEIVEQFKPDRDGFLVDRDQSGFRGSGSGPSVGSDGYFDGGIDV